MIVTTHDVAVIGAGLAGLTATFAMAREGFSVVNIAPVSPIRDGRSTALLADTMGFFDRLGLGEKLREGAAPLSVMRIVDATARIPRAPQVEFRSSEIDLDAFGYNVQNADAVNLLRKEIEGSTDAVIVDAALDDIIVSDGDGPVVLQLSNGQEINCHLLVGADGRQSKVREKTKFGERVWSYPQSALVLNFSHVVAHDNISTEFHTPTGPFTIVPMPGKQSSLVWVETPARANELAALPAAQLAVEIETLMQSMLGRVELTTKPQCFPLSGMIAHRFGMGPVVLVGEAGHAFPPIGAQGFNLGIRDIETATDLAVGVGQERFHTIGEEYHRRRRRDVQARSVSVDLLNRSLLSRMPPAQFARAFGLSLLTDFSPIRRFAMREGVSPGLGMHSLFGEAKPDFLNRLGRKSA